MGPLDQQLQRIRTEQEVSRELCLTARRRIEKSCELRAITTEIIASRRATTGARLSVHAVLRVDWQEKDPEKVLGSAPDLEAVQGIVRLFKTLTRT